MNQYLFTGAKYYHRFKIVIGTPLWRIYLRWAYKTCIDDFRALGFKPTFDAPNFTALLCGVGNETTADEFIKFVITRNNKAKIVIIDIGAEQIRAVVKLVQNKYASVNIIIKQLDALELLSFLPDASINWIETDGFLGYFDRRGLHRLIKIWQTLLVDSGFITIRELVSNGRFGDFIDRIKIWIAEKWLGVDIYIHTKTELETILGELKFKFVTGPTPLPTFKRYAIIKNRQTV